ncbi:hypothetical protein KUCAC02_034345, partial [Chaenocephalus aceratus]
YGERSRSPAVFPQQDVPPHAGLKAHFITEGTQPGQRKSIISHTQILPLTVMHTSRPAAQTLISLPLRRTFITGTLRGALSGVSLRAESHFVSAVSRERPPSVDMTPLASCLHTRNEGGGGCHACHKGSSSSRCFLPYAAVPPHEEEEGARFLLFLLTRKRRERGSSSRGRGGSTIPPILLTRKRREHDSSSSSSRGRGGSTVPPHEERRR